jgi:ankyrin repeat protein
MFVGQLRGKRTPLMIAAGSNNIEEVKKLLYDGADPNLVNPVGYSALHFSIRASTEDPYITKLLISYGANVNIPCRKKETPLMIAVRNRHEEKSLALVTHGADCNAQNGLDDTPLHLAAMVGHENIFRLLLEHGSNPKIKNRYFDTAEDIAKSRFKDEAQRDRIIQLLNKTTTTG